MNSIVPALLTSNTVILKHTTQTILCAERYSATFTTTNLPNNVFQHVHTTHKTIATMINDPRIGFVAFTNSIKNNHTIQTAASTHFINTKLKLNNKNPSYMHHDTNITLTITKNVDNTFFNTNQSYYSIERIYVHKRVYDQFVKNIQTKTLDYVLNNPRNQTTTINPMVTTKTTAFVRDQINKTLTQNTQTITRETNFTASATNTPYLNPTILININHSISVMHDKSFKPIINIIKISNNNKTITLMNNSPYNLSTYI